MTAVLSDSSEGALVVIKMAPDVAFLPYSAPCGPFRTSIWAISRSSLLKALGLVCKTPSTTKAKFDSASLVEVKPLIVTKVSPTLTVFAMTTFGVKAMKSSGLSIPASLISLEVKTLIAIGTS